MIDPLKNVTIKQLAENIGTMEQKPAGFLTGRKFTVTIEENEYTFSMKEMLRHLKSQIKNIDNELTLEDKSYLNLLKPKLQNLNNEQIKTNNIFKKMLVCISRLNNYDIGFTKKHLFDSIPDHAENFSKPLIPAFDQPIPHSTKAANTQPTSSRTTKRKFEQLKAFFSIDTKTIQNNNSIDPALKLKITQDNSNSPLLDLTPIDLSFGSQATFGEKSAVVLVKAEEEIKSLLEKSKSEHQNEHPWLLNYNYNSNSYQIAYLENGTCKIETIKIKEDQTLLEILAAINTDQKRFLVKDLLIDIRFASFFFSDTDLINKFKRTFVNTEIIKQENALLNESEKGNWYVTNRVTHFSTFNGLHFEIDNIDGKLESTYKEINNKQIRNKLKDSQYTLVYREKDSDNKDSYSRIDIPTSMDVCSLSELETLISNEKKIHLSNSSFCDMKEFFVKT